MMFLKALVPLGLLIMGGTVLDALAQMAQQGYAGILWTLGAFLCISFVAMALYYIGKFFGKKDEDENEPDQ